MTRPTVFIDDDCFLCCETSPTGTGTTGTGTHPVCCSPPCVLLEVDYNGCLLLEIVKLADAYGFSCTENIATGTSTGTGTAHISGSFSCADGVYYLTADIGGVTTVFQEDIDGSTTCFPLFRHGTFGGIGSWSITETDCPNTGTSTGTGGAACGGCIKFPNVFKLLASGFSGDVSPDLDDCSSLNGEWRLPFKLASSGASNFSYHWWTDEIRRFACVEVDPAPYYELLCDATTVGHDTPGWVLIAGGGLAQYYAETINCCGTSTLTLATSDDLCCTNIPTTITIVAIPPCVVEPGTTFTLCGTANNTLFLGVPGLGTFTMIEFESAWTSTADPGCGFQLVCDGTNWTLTIFSTSTTYTATGLTFPLTFLGVDVSACGGGTSVTVTVSE